MVRSSTITISVASPSQLTISTQSLTPGTPTQTTLQGNPAISISYTSNLSQTVTATVYASIENSIGQVVYYTTSTITLAPGQTQTATLAIFGLPPGTYTAYVWAVVNNTVASPTSTLTLTIS